MHEAEQFISDITPVVGVGEVQRLHEVFIARQLPEVGVVHGPAFRPRLERSGQMAGRKEQRRRHRQAGRKLAAPEDPIPATGSIVIFTNSHYCGTWRSRIRMRCWARAIASAMRAAASPRASMVSSLMRCRNNWYWISAAYGRSALSSDSAIL